MMKKSTDHWFKPRRYGHGATPVTWQGWAALIALVILILLVALALMWVMPNVWGILAFVFFVPPAVFGFITFVREKTDGEWRWSWGYRP